MTSASKPPPDTERTAHRKEVRKEDQIRIRVTADQKVTLTEAAAKAGLGVSSWLLSLGIREARKLSVK